jgi:hypothetical protein
MNFFWIPKTSFHDPEYTPTFYEFETTEELLALPIVQRFNRSDAEFVLSDHHLMVLNKDGFEWWVVGAVSDPSVVNLPKWRGPKIRVRLEDGQEIIAQDGTVLSICGNEIMLKGGRKVTRI